MVGPAFVRTATQFTVIAGALFAALIAGGISVDADEPAAKPAASAEKVAAGIDFFETKVRPVLVENCHDCHCSQTAESGLRLDALAGLLKGGTRGPAVVPGKPEQSLLISAINHGEVLQMPPKEKLSPAQIGDLTAWVKMGCPWPDAKPVEENKDEKEKPKYTDEQKNYWAFKSPVAAQPPAVKDRNWVRNSIDQFILSALEGKGIKPVPEADKRTLIRRATFDLTGLPPTTEEIDGFLSDNAPDAYERLIERLLASPHYGERWGRHWLDVARYADSNGMDENIAFASAFRYRDYVIAAFNSDKPYDRFVHEQLAGDLLAPRENETQAEYHERLIATGFLAIGPKMLADDDPIKKQMDIVDEQVDTTCRALMGLTVGCARCHDHKFDPIPTADYYGLAGIFKSTQTMEDLGVVAKWYEYEIPTTEELAHFEAHKKQLAEVESRLAQRTQAARAEFAASERSKAGRYLLAASQYLGAAGDAVPDGRRSIGDFVTRESVTARGALVEAEAFNRGTVQVDKDNWGKDIGVLLQTGFAEYDVELPEAGHYQLELRYAAQEARPLMINVNGTTVKWDGAGAVTGGWSPADQAWHLEGVYEFQAGKNVIRLERDKVFPHVDKLLVVRMPKLTDREQLKPVLQLGHESDVHNAIIVEAENYTRGTLLKRGPVVLNGGDGNFFNEAEYEIDVPADGRYQLDMLYTSGETRSFKLSIDDYLVNEQAANRMTGGFDDSQVQWFAEGIYELSKGRATIRIEQTGPTPHLDRLALVPTELPPTVVFAYRAGRRSAREWARDLNLNEAVLRGWIDYLRKQSAHGNSFWRTWIAKNGLSNESAAHAQMADGYQKLFDGVQTAADGKSAISPTDAFKALIDDANGPFSLADRPERFFSESARNEIAELTKEKATVEASAPEMARAMGVREGTIGNVRIHLRGSHLTLGPEVPRKFLSVITCDSSSPINDKQSGRLQLARWLTSPKHPLTSRVMINRIWRWHFGSGLVRTPDNFGHLGEMPTNQPLLDWLACEFIRCGWSMKEMHRLIMLSSTYRMSSQFNVAAAEVDPENKLYWHMPRRRMEAEEIRDSILALADNLDARMCGQLLKDKNRDYVTGTGSKVNSYDFNRRSLYLPVLRSAVYEVLQAFDFADPSALNGERATTTVTPQALFMMNSSLVSDNTQRMADGLLGRGDLDDASRIRVAFLRTYGRQPRSDETERFLAFAKRLEETHASSQSDKDETRQKTWRNLCRVLISSNEFIYIE